MDTTNFQKKSPRDSTKKSEKSSNSSDAPAHRASTDPHDYERYEERTFDLVGRVRAASDAAQRRMDEFGDVSEYTVTKIYGRKKEPPVPETQSSLNFQTGNSDETPIGEENK